ncbi:MAG: DUF4175 family protein [Hellea sp.]|nr:DUF4175 family protein [Hellea sp.]
MSSRNAFLLKKAQRLTRSARALLYWEQYSPVYALAAFLIALFMIGSFSGLWQLIGDPWRLIVLIAAVVILGRSIWRARKLRRPDISAARRRVEEDSNVRHRPLDTLYDRPALSEEGWPEHYRKAEDVVDRLKRPRLRPALGKVDKYFLRFATPAALVLALMVGAGDSFERLRHSLTPGWVNGSLGDDITFEAWIDPPEYTGRPPVYFKKSNQLEAPQGSELVARIIGTKNPTRLKLRSENGTKHISLKRIGPDSFEVRAIIDQSSTASWRIGEVRKNWAIDAIVDQPPTVAFVRDPEADKRDRLAFAYSLEDDYGVETLTLRMTLLQDDETAPIQTRDVNVSISGNAKRIAESNAALDLTKHEWAAKKVSAILIAKDGLGQMAESEITYFRVPDKIFVEPLAKAIIENRSLVIAGNEDYAPIPQLSRKEMRNRPWFDTWQPEFRLDRAPAPIQRASLLIDAITDQPASMYDDAAVYMGLRNVASRIRYARSAEELDGIPDDLWNIAIRAEFGLLGTALEEMQAAEAALREGIARHASQREIDTLFDRYNEAVARYREELLRQAIEDGNVAENGGGGEGPSINTDQIQELLDAIEEANRIGDSEGARRALAQLAELLENMQIQLSQGGGGSGDMPMDGEMSEEMKDALEELADLLGEQRELRDQTREAERAERNGEQSGQSQGSGETSDQAAGEEPGAPNGGEDGAMSAEELAELQSRLLDLLEQADDVMAGLEEGESGSGGDEVGEDGAGIDPEISLEDARRAMAEAEEALRNGDLGLADEEQLAAIQALREAGRGLAEQARRDLEGSEAGREGLGDQSDPLGRNNNGGENNDDSELDIDGRDSAERSRELQEEIRRRAAEQERAQEELEYLERLLRRF